MPSMQAIRFAILIILLTRFSAIFFMSQFRYRTGICRWKTCRTSLTCLASMSLEVDFFTSLGLRRQTGAAARSDQDLAGELRHGGLERAPIHSGAPCQSARSRHADHSRHGIRRCDARALVVSP